MFNVKVTYGSGHNFSVQTPIMADCLPEAEAAVTCMLGRVFPDFTLVMVHEGELRYSVYEVHEPFATVEIETGD